MMRMFSAGISSLTVSAPLRMILKQPIILAALSVWRRTSAESLEDESSPTVLSKSSSRRMDHSSGGYLMFLKKEEHASYARTIILEDIK